MNKKIIISLGIIGLAAAIAIGATTAFFSDTETSTGNTFTAGAIDLKIDNTSYVTDNAGELVASPSNTWTLDDLIGKLFFSFADLKPGDIGEDTISLHVYDNDAYACMAVDITATPENGINNPEALAGDVTEEGELQNYLQFAFWADDGDNVYEEGEEIFWKGTSAELFNGNWQVLADSQGSVWGSPVTYTSGSMNFSSTGWGGWSCPAGMNAVGGGTIDRTQPIGAEGIAKTAAIIGGVSYPVFPHYTFATGETGYVVQNGGTSQTMQVYVDCLPNASTITGGQEYYIAKAWCFGELEENPVVAGDNNNPTIATGFICNGAGNHNDAQTDGIVADVSFYAVQSRNNAGFTCSSMNIQPVHVTSATLNYGPTGWGGWSCPANTTVVNGSLVVSGGDLAQTFAWLPGATTGTVNYPYTPFGYTYVSGETGYIGQNDNDSGESIVLDFDCMPN